jgi:cobalt-zinc-cadmium efflux system membrane fusion protein
MGGYLRSTKLLPGMHVSRGEVIAVVEDQALIQLQQDYLVAVAKLGFLQQEFERQKLLNENKVNADKVYQQAQADYSSQKVMVKGYSEKLKLVGINPVKLSEDNVSKSVAVHSPINGFVSKVNVNIGKYVTGTDILFELINPDDMHAALTIYEKILPKLK